jgi:hypothetical protein
MLVRPSNEVRSIWAVQPAHDGDTTGCPRHCSGDAYAAFWITPYAVAGACVSTACSPKLTYLKKRPQKPTKKSASVLGRVGATRPTLHFRPPGCRNRRRSSKPMGRGVSAMDATLTGMVTVQGLNCPNVTPMRTRRGLCPHRAHGLAPPAG